MARKKLKTAEEKVKKLRDKLNKVKKDQHHQTINSKEELESKQ